MEIRDFVLSCEICQQEKSVHRVPAGLLEPLTLPKQKWADVSLDFIMGLPRSIEGFDGILIVVDRATKMIHLMVVNQTITVAETALVFRNTVGKLHGIPRSVVSDRDPRFVSKLWQELWRLLGTKLCMPSAHHPQTDGQTEAVALPPSGAARSQVDQGRRRGYHKMKLQNHHSAMFKCTKMLIQPLQPSCDAQDAAIC